MAMTNTLEKVISKIKNIQEMTIFLEEANESDSHMLWSLGAQQLIQTWIEKIIEGGEVLCGISLTKLLQKYVEIFDMEQLKASIPNYLLLNNMVELSTKWSNQDSQLLSSFWDIVNGLFLTVFERDQTCFDDYMVDLLTAYINRILKEDNVSYLRELTLKTFNTFIESCDHIMKINLRQLNEDCVEQLITCMTSAGNYEFQISLLEAVFRITTHSERKQNIKFWLPNANSKTIDLFLMIKDFDPDCRKFLNNFNQSLGEERKVHTLESYEALLGTFSLQKPNIPSYEHLWVDFNTEGPSISVLFDRADPNVPSAKRMWETLIVYEHEIDHCVLSVFDTAQILIVTLQADPESLFASPPSPDSSRLISKELSLKFINQKDSLIMQCQNLFGEKFKINFLETYNLNQNAKTSKVKHQKSSTTSDYVANLSTENLYPSDTQPNSLEMVLPKQLNGKDKKISLKESESQDRNILTKPIVEDPSTERITGTIVLSQDNCNEFEDNLEPNQYSNKHIQTPLMEKRIMASVSSCNSGSSKNSWKNFSVNDKLSILSDKRKCSGKKYSKAESMAVQVGSCKEEQAPIKIANTCEIDVIDIESNDENSIIPATPLDTSTVSKRKSIKTKKFAKSKNSTSKDSINLKFSESLIPISKKSPVQHQPTYQDSDCPIVNLDEAEIIIQPKSEVQSNNVVHAANIANKKTDYEKQGIIKELKVVCVREQFNEDCYVVNSTSPASHDQKKEYSPLREIKNGQKITFQQCTNPLPMKTNDKEAICNSLVKKKDEKDVSKNELPQLSEMNNISALYDGQRLNESTFKTPVKVSGIRKSPSSPQNNRGRKRTKSLPCPKEANTDLKMIKTAFSTTKHCASEKKPKKQLFNYQTNNTLTMSPPKTVSSYNLPTKYPLTKSTASMSTSSKIDKFPVHMKKAIFSSKKDCKKKKSPTRSKKLSKSTNKKQRKSPSVYDLGSSDSDNWIQDSTRKKDRPSYRTYRGVAEKSKLKNRKISDDNTWTPYRKKSKSTAQEFSPRPYSVEETASDENNSLFKSLKEKAPEQPKRRMTRSFSRQTNRSIVPEKSYASSESFASALELSDSFPGKLRDTKSSFESNTPNVAPDFKLAVPGLQMFKRKEKMNLNDEISVQSINDSVNQLPTEDVVAIDVDPHQSSLAKSNDLEMIESCESHAFSSPMLNEELLDFRSNDFVGPLHSTANGKAKTKGKTFTYIGQEEGSFEKTTDKNSSRDKLSSPSLHQDLHFEINPINNEISSASTLKLSAISSSYPFSFYETSNEDKNVTENQGYPEQSKVLKLPNIEKSPEQIEMSVTEESSSIFPILELPPTDDLQSSDAQNQKRRKIVYTKVDGILGNNQIYKETPEGIQPKRLFENAGLLGRSSRENRRPALKTEESRKHISLDALSFLEENVCAISEQAVDLSHRCYLVKEYLRGLIREHSENSS